MSKDNCERYLDSLVVGDLTDGSGAFCSHTIMLCFTVALNLITHWKAETRDAMNHVCIEPLGIISDT